MEASGRFAGPETKQQWLITRPSGYIIITDPTNSPVFDWSTSLDHFIIKNILFMTFLL
jgi:hypothetical protein